jgi:hypothetical protein
LRYRTEIYSIKSISYISKDSLERYSKIYSRIFLYRIIPVIPNNHLELGKNAAVVMICFRIGRAQ